MFLNPFSFLGGSSCDGSRFQLIFRENFEKEGDVNFKTSFLIHRSTLLLLQHGAGSSPPFFAFLVPPPPPPSWIGDSVTDAGRES